MFEFSDIMHDGHDTGYAVTTIHDRRGYAKGAILAVRPCDFPFFCFQIDSFTHLGHPFDRFSLNFGIRIDALIPPFAVNFFNLVAGQIDHFAIPECELNVG